MCKSASDPTCQCACIDGCTPQCYRDYSNYLATRGPDPNLVIIGATSEEERKLTTEDPEISGRISKEYCQEAKDGLIEDLKRENKFLEERTQNLSAELRSEQMKSAELEKKLNVRKKLWGFSWGNVLNWQLLAALVFLGLAVTQSSWEAIVVCSTLALIMGFSSLFNKPKLPKIVAGISICLLGLTGYLMTMPAGGVVFRTKEISSKADRITQRIHSPEAILKKEKEKLEQELKDVKEELKKKKIVYY